MTGSPLTLCSSSVACCRLIALLDAFRFVSYRALTPNTGSTSPIPKPHHQLSTLKTHPKPTHSPTLSPPPLKIHLSIIKHSYPLSLSKSQKIHNQVSTAKKKNATYQSKKSPQKLIRRAGSLDAGRRGCGMARAAFVMSLKMRIALLQDYCGMLMIDLFGYLLACLEGLLRGRYSLSVLY